MLLVECEVGQWYRLHFYSYSYIETTDAVYVHLCDSVIRIVSETYSIRHTFLHLVIQAYMDRLLLQCSPDHYIEVVDPVCPGPEQ